MALITFSPSTTIKSADMNSNLAGLANGSLMNSPTINDLSVTNLGQVAGEYQNAAAATIAINAANGDRQFVPITQATALTFSGFVQGQIVTLRIVENSTGNYSISLPTCKWPYGAPGTFTTTANAINVLTIYFDGTNYLAQLSPGFA